MNPSNQVAWGLEDEVDVMFSDKSDVPAGGQGQAHRAFDRWVGSRPRHRCTARWASGQEHLEGGITIIDARVGKGRLALFGPQVSFAASPSTFKFVFNGIVQSVVDEETVQ